MSSFWKRCWKGFAFLFAAAIVFIVFDLRTGGRLQCLVSGYEKFDSYVGGVVYPEKNKDGTPNQSIASIPLGDESRRVKDTFVNVTDLISCRDSYSTAARISYVELHSRALSLAVEAWKRGEGDSFGFRKGDIFRDFVSASYNGNGRPGIRVWNSEYALSNAPSWFPSAKVGPQSFVAFWGDGHLFIGDAPDQFFWIGYFQ